MSFYKNTGITKEVRAQLLAEKVIARYLEDSNPYRTKAKKYKTNSCRLNRMTTPLYVANTQKQSDLGSEISTALALMKKDNLKLYLIELFKKGQFIKYKDLLKNIWHCYNIKFDIAKK